MSDQDWPLNVPTKMLWAEWPPNDGLLPGHPYFDAVVADVRQNGIRQPLSIRRDWAVMDGQHRFAAARVLGIEWVPVRIWTGFEWLPATTPPPFTWTPKCELCGHELVPKGCPQCGSSEAEANGEAIEAEGVNG